MPAAVIGAAMVAASFVPGIVGASILASIGVSLLAGSVASMFAKKPKLSEGDRRGRTETINSPVATTVLWLGECRIGGTLTWWHAHGYNDNELRTVIITHADHRVEGDFRLLLGNEQVDGIDNIRTGHEGGEFGPWDDTIPAKGEGANGDWWRDTKRQTIWWRPRRGNTRGVWKRIGSYPYDFEFFTSLGSQANGSFAESGGALYRRVSGSWQKVSPLTYPGETSDPAKQSPNYRVEEYSPGRQSPYRREVDNSGGELWFMRWRHYAGNQQVADDWCVEAPLSDWQASAVGYEKAYTRLVTRFHTGVFPRGHPPIGEISVIGKGALAYDPRIGPNAGAADYELHDGTVVKANQVKWTRNWALLVAHYLTWPDKGVSIPWSRIDADELIASADVSDELVEVISGVPAWSGNTAYGVGDKVRVLDGSVWRIYRAIEAGTSSGSSPPTGTSNRLPDGSVLWNFHHDRYEPRYTIDGVVKSDDNFARTLSEFEAAGAGHIFKFGAKWVIWAGRHVATPADLFFGEDAIIPPIEMEPFAGMREAHNCVRGTYPEPKENYRPVSYPSVESAIYKAEDNGETVWGEMDFPWTPSRYASYRLAVIALRRMRLAGTGAVYLPPRTIHVGPLSVVQLTYNRFQWVARPFQVLGFSHEPPQRGPVPEHPFLVKLSVVGYNAGIWDNPGDHLDDDPALVVNTANALDVLPPTGLAVSTVAASTVSLAQDGKLLVKVKITWEAPEDPYVKQYEVQWQRTGDQEWSSMLVAERSQNQVLLEGLDLASSYKARVRSISRFDQRLRSDEDWDDPWQSQLTFWPSMVVTRGLRAPPIDGTLGDNQIPNPLGTQSVTHPDTARHGVNNDRGALAWVMEDEEFLAGGGDGYIARFDTPDPNWTSKSLFQMQINTPTAAASGGMRFTTETILPCLQGDLMYARLGRAEKRSITTGTAPLTYYIVYYNEDDEEVGTRIIGSALGGVAGVQSFRRFFQVPRGMGIVGYRPRLFLLNPGAGEDIGYNLQLVSCRPSTRWPANRGQTRVGIASSDSPYPETGNLWWTVIGHLGDFLWAPKDGGSFVFYATAQCQVMQAATGPHEVQARLVRYLVNDPDGSPSVTLDVVIESKTTFASVQAGQIVAFRVGMSAEDDGSAKPFSPTARYAYRFEMRTSNNDLVFNVRDSTLTVDDQ